jgi:hypothetical protein
MKVNILNVLIAIAVSALITYGLVNIEGSPMKWYVAVGSALLLCVTLIQMIGINFTYSRSGVNLRVVSSIFFVIALLNNLLYSFISFSEVSYFVTNGMILLLFFSISSSIYRAKQ